MNAKRTSKSSTKQASKKTSPTRSPRRTSARKTQAQPKNKPQAINIQRIVVPVDFSKRSEGTLQYAVAFALQHQARITLLHVVEPVIYPAEMGFAGGSLETMELNMQDTARTRLEEWAHTHVPQGVEVDTQLRIGNPYLEITNLAKKMKADMIIISTHGYTGLKHVFLGSTAERVVRHATCPVLTIRKKGGA